MIKTCVDLFGQQPKQYTSPLERGDHPELDNTEELDSKHIKICQSMIGAPQWAIQETPRQAKNPIIDRPGTVPGAV